MITVYTLTYNEELLIQFMIDHYRSRFPGCHIVVYDNSSTDRTVEIAKANNCEVQYYNSNNSLDDGLHAKIKNTCWKTAKTDWVLVCDLDEMLDITQDELLYEESIGTTIINPEGWEMINLYKEINLSKIVHGVRHIRYDKKILFNKKFIKEMNYGVGSHECSPSGIVNISNIAYKIYHYKHLSFDLVLAKTKLTKKRLSDNNKKNLWGMQCFKSTEEIKKYYEYLVNTAIKIKK